MLASRSGRSDERPTSQPRSASAFDDRDDLRVVADRGADEAHPPGVARDRLEHTLGRDDAHAAVGGAPHHAVGAAARAPALGLDEEHVGELGVRRADRRVRGQHRVVLRADRREVRVAGRDEDVRDLPRGASSCASRVPGALDRAHRVDDARVGLADDDGVDDRRRAASGWRR